jgi:hypothetical protein
MMTLKIDGGDKVEIIGESFVCVTFDEPKAEDLYVDLDSLSPRDREDIVSMREQMISLTNDLAERLLSIRRKEAA